MAAVLIDVADAVVTALNAASFSQDITAERSYADWDLPLEDEVAAGELRVDVVPVARVPTELDDRSSVKYEPAVDVVVRKKFNQEDLRENDDKGRVKLGPVDDLVLLVEEIHAELVAVVMADPTAHWQGAEILAAVTHKHLKEQKQFTGIIRVTFDAHS